MYYIYGGGQMKAKTKKAMKMGMAAATVVAVGMYFKKNPEALNKVKEMAMKMKEKTSNMDFDALYEEM